MSSTCARAAPRQFHVRLIVLSALLIFATVAAHAQVSLRVRGTITGFDGNVLTVKTREGKDLQLKPGEYVFTTAQVAADGTMIVQRIQVSRDGVKPPQ